MENLKEKNNGCNFTKPLTIVAIVLSSISLLLSVFTLVSGRSRHRDDFRIRKPYSMQTEMNGKRQDSHFRKFDNKSSNRSNGNQSFGKKSSNPNRPHNFNSQNNNQNQPNRKKFSNQFNDKNLDKQNNSSNSINNINPPSNNAPNVSPSVSPATELW